MTQFARVVGSASAGVEPGVMGIGPVPAVRKLLARAGLTVDDLDFIKLDDAIARLALARFRDLGMAGEFLHVIPNPGHRCHGPSSGHDMCTA